jgi:peptidoglycan LD-endopeptidase LytH
VRSVVSRLLYFVAGAILLAVLRHHVEIRQLSLPFRLLRLQAQSPDTVLAMPIRTVSVNRVANTWHAPRSNGRTHQGVDIFTRRGTPILSASEGIVTRIGENGLGGKTVMVTGRGGRAYYYAHLADFAPDLSVGDSVHENTVLGFVGNTGNARTTSPHLHFGIYSAAGAINPLPLLVDRAVPRGRPGAA